MIYQGDSYTFTLFLGRSQTTTITISSVSNSAGVSTYTYAIVSGPPLQLGQKVTVSGMSSVNNGPFTINALGTNTFASNSASGTTETRSGSGTVGTLPNVTTSPVIQIVSLTTFTAQLGSAAAMTALDGTNQVWSYTWSVGSAPSSQYIAIVSYVADGNTFNSHPIEKISVGDTRVTGAVALDSTVAKDATVAKDTTVAHVSDVQAIAPENDPVIQDIKAKVDALPADPAGITALSGYLSDIVDIHDAVLGNQVVDKTQNPPLYTIKRLDNSTLAEYAISDNSTTTSRIKQ